MVKAQRDAGWIGFLASLFTASRILPSDHQATLHLFELGVEIE